MLQIPGAQKARSLKRCLQKIIRCAVKFFYLSRNPISIAVVLAVVAALCLYFLRRLYGDFGDMYQGVYVEAVGATMDIVIFGIVIALFDLWRRRRVDISRQEEIIDDFKKWNSDEARHRIAGAIRRLNRLGRTSIDLGGVEISNFSFIGNDIRSIAGSTLYDGDWGTMGRKDKVRLESVDFAFLDCRDVTFSMTNVLSNFRSSFVFAQFKDCNFANADLTGAKFRGAHLTWSAEPPEEMGELIDTGDGQTAFHQTYYPPFSDTNLTSVSFRKATFKNADFRDAPNICDCDFREARGLDTCTFDDDKTRDAILHAARSKKPRM